MALVGDIYVVPSGKVYRQIFDAEVQLVRSLGEARDKALPHRTSLDSGKLSDTEGHSHTAGILSDRQRSWVDSMPYDSTTENPVLYRAEITSVLKETQESEDAIAAREVRGLCDTIVAEKKDSGVLQRIAANRQIKHENAIFALHKELADIGKNTEALVLEVGRLLKEKLSESDQKVNLLFQQMDEDNAYTSFSLEGLHKVREQVSDESLFRRSSIKDLGKTLIHLEEKRADSIAEVLKKFTSLLTEICYLMPSDVHRLIHKEAMMINQAILANHRAIAKLSINLMEADLKREGVQHLRWQDLVKAWRRFQKETTVQEFRGFIEDQASQVPKLLKEEVDFSIGLQKSLNEKIVQQLHMARYFLPPTCTKNQVTEWHESLNALNQDTCSLKTEFLARFRCIQEDMSHRCFAESEKYKEHLISLNICSKEEADGIMTNQICTLTESFQIEHDKEQEWWEKALNTICKETNLQIEKVFKITIGAVHLWDVLDIGLKKQENSLQEYLEACRQKFDAENQAKETDLILILEKLRKENTQELLQSTKGKALMSLNNIKAGYQMYHEDQVNIVESYPASVMKELLEYSSTLSRYFGVKEVYGQEFIAGMPKQLDTEQGAEDTMEGPQEGAPELSFQSKETSLVDESTSHQEGLETFTTSRRNLYIVLCSELCESMKKEVSFREKSEDTGIFITEASVTNQGSMQLDEMIIPENVFIRLIEQIRLGFYEHLEHCFDNYMASCHSFVMAKKEELKSELNVRNHHHVPRSKRVELDIHNVRAAELLLHEDRVERHCKGVDQSLKQLKEESSLLIEKMKQQSFTFRNKISGMETIFLHANKSDKLVALNNSLASILDNHLSGVQTTMRQYRQQLEKMLGKLRDTNSDFINSLQLFSEGGNFSPEEVETYSKKMHTLSSIIASFEESILADLEGLESLCLEQAKDVVKKFEERFQVLTTDTIFLENIQKMLTNLQVKIKGLVVNSNLQTQQINSYLDQLEKKTDACAHPNLDKEAVTSEALYTFAKTVMLEIIKRSMYLSCLLEPRSFHSETLLQGPIAAASRVESPLRSETRLASGTPDTLLIPSRIGKYVVDDVAVSVIKNIMKSQKTGDLPRETDVSNHPPVIGVPRQSQSLSMAPQRPSPPASGSSSRRKATKVDVDTNKFSSPGVRKLAKPSRFDKKYQVFGENKQESDNFRGLVTAVLWESNDALLYLAEEFYKRKERRSVGRPDLLQDTFEECADVMVQKLQSYEKQALEYHNSCLLGFRDQLERFEKLVSHVPPLVIENLRCLHLERLRSSTHHLRQGFSEDLNKWQSSRDEMKNLLRPSLGHPENCETLEDLCQHEELRQKGETSGIDVNAQSLEDCVSACVESFITSLAALTEKMLLELDEMLTVDDVTQGRTEKPKERLSTLIRRKQAGLPLENTDYQPLIDRGSRVWPGIVHSNAEDIKQGNSTACQATASVTTAKITLSHISAMEARDSLHKSFIKDAAHELNRIKEEKQQHHLAAQRWRDWWQQSIFKIKELYV
uniref:Coiled-coil domain-containing protein 180 n=1 Tax=Leptobrachium leishanense TaxID=445787 RepID=A0A8C5QK75_9ANUR